MITILERQLKQHWLMKERYFVVLGCDIHYGAVETTTHHGAPSLPSASRHSLLSWISYSFHISVKAIHFPFHSSSGHLFVKCALQASKIQSRLQASNLCYLMNAIMHDILFLERAIIVEFFFPGLAKNTEQTSKMEDLESFLAALLYCTAIQQFAENIGPLKQNCEYKFCYSSISILSFRQYWWLPFNVEAFSRRNVCLNGHD